MRQSELLQLEWKKQKKLTTSKLPGATIRLSMTLLIFVTRDKIEDYMQETNKKNSVSEHKQDRAWAESGGGGVDCQMLKCLQAHLLCRRGAQVLVSLQQTLTESRLVRCWLNSGEGHLTLVTNNSLFQYTHTSLLILKSVDDYDSWIPVTTKNYATNVSEWTNDP